MGLDIHYQAMPENCELLIWARNEPDFVGANLEFFNSYALMSPEKLQKKAEVFDIQNKLETVTIERLHCHWNPQAMSEAGVYKSHVDQNENDFQWIHGNFEKFKAFYTLVADHNEGVLAFVS